MEEAATKVRSKLVKVLEEGKENKEMKDLEAEANVHFPDALFLIDARVLASPTYSHWT